MKFMPESIEGDRPKPLFDNPQVHPTPAVLKR